MPKNNFQVIVIGGGHAGTEAALAASRLGAKCLLITHSIETLGQMSCNPAIGGIGKGHLVKEIDALGGVMAHAADSSGIQFRTLNSSKGHAVRATRAQTDRQLYKQYILSKLENAPNLFLFQQAVDDLIIQQDKITGVVTQSGLKFFAPSIVLTAGTFLAGKIHIGNTQYAAGRAGDPSCVSLAHRLREIFPHTERLKTGTPPRIDKRTVDFSQLQEQPGDDPIPSFSYLGTPQHHPRQTHCHITHTNEKTHQIILSNLQQSPLYNGKIEGTGPRYCPSIEDKVVRFSDKSAHQIFIEPESLQGNELYPNGISTSLPYTIQEEFIRSIKGFENAHITRPGYAIEYDFFDPTQLQSCLQTKHIRGLFFAGQINGTTGYEEAAAQGLIAGTNAACLSLGKPFLTLGRDQAYIGVLIDDLVTLGTQEPYRMFTSRAEYRLLLREDNADLRLTPIGKELGLVSDFRWRCFEQKRAAIESETLRLKNNRLHHLNLTGEANTEISELSQQLSLSDLLKRGEWNYQKIKELSPNNITFNLRLTDSATDEAPEQNLALVLKEQVEQQIEIQHKYDGYLKRQEQEIKRLKSRENQKIPEQLDYQILPGLSNEIKQKLQHHQPQTIGQASRISGVTPAAISIIIVAVKKHDLTFKVA